MELIYYYYEQEDYNYISVFVKSICKLYKVNLTLVPSVFPWSSVGDLPVLQIGSYLYRDQNIFRIMTHILELNFKIPADSESALKELQELCHNSIHKYIKVLRSKTSNAAEAFKYKLSQMNELFYQSLKLVKTQDFTFNYSENVNHALGLIHKTNEVLSEFLGINDCFSQEFTFSHHLHFVDLAIYAYIKEELFYLGHLEEIRNDFVRFENLKKFVKFVEEKIELAGGVADLKQKLDSIFIKEFSESRGHTKEVKLKDQYKGYRREFVTASVLSFLAVLLINSR